MSEAFNAGSIASTLRLDIDPYAQGMLQATTIARLFPETVTSFLANPLLGFIDIAKETTGYIRELFSESAELGDSMGDLANQVGVGVEGLTALGDIAAMSGSSVEGLADSYRFLGRSVADAMADANSASAKTFRSIDVEFLTAEGAVRPLQEIMLDLADAITKLPEGAARTKVAMDLLGRSGTELVPTLMQGKAALTEQMDQMQRYGAVVTETSHDTADRWKDATDEMGFAWMGLREAIAVPLRSALLPLLEDDVKYLRVHQPEIRDRIEAAFSIVGELPAMLAPYLNWLRESWRDVAAVAAGVATYMAGPAVLGAILKIGPAIFQLLSPMNALKESLLALKAVFAFLDPEITLTNALIRLASIALGTLAFEAIRSPQSLGPLAMAIRYVGAAGLYVWDVLEHVVSPAIGKTLSGAFEHLRPYLPSTAGLFRVFQSAVQGVAAFLVQMAIPAIGTGLSAAFDWIGPKLNLAGGVVLYLWDVLKSFASWASGPATDALVNGMGAAWDYLRGTIAIVTPYVDSVYAVLSSTINWMMTVAVPAIGGAFAGAWNILVPVVSAVGKSIATIYSTVLLPITRYLATTGASAVATIFGGAWRTIIPIITGAWSVMHGVFTWIGAALSWLNYAVGPVMTGVTKVIQALAAVIGVVWVKVLQPVVTWLWAVCEPVIEAIGKTIGWLLDKVGKLLDWLGHVITLSGDATKAVNNVPSPPASGGPQTQVSGPGQLPAAFPAVPLPQIPKFDAGAYAARAGNDFKAIGDAIGDGTKQGVDRGLDQVRKLELKLPEIKMPPLRLPDLGALGRIGAGSGVEPLQDRFDDLKRGTDHHVNAYEAAKHQEPPDLRAERRAFNEKKNDYNRRIMEAIHGGANAHDLDALRREKALALAAANPDRSPAAQRGRTAAGTSSPTINVQSPAIDENKLAKAIAKEVGAENDKKISAAQRAARQVRDRQIVAEVI